MQLFSSWTGGDFLLFYTILLGLALAASWWILFNLRPAGRRSESLDAESLAMLAGGRQRLAESVIADLYARGGLANAGGGKLTVVRSDIPAGGAGKALLALDGNFKIGSARKALAVAADQTAARLRRQGLFAFDDQIGRIRWLSVAPFVVLFVIGVYRERAGSALGEPTGFLIALMTATAIAGVVRFASLDNRTAGGIETVNRMAEKEARLRLAPRPEEAAMAVALFGTGVLVGTPWEAVHAMRQQGSGDSGSSGDGDGGGGCGGGCGGCGG